MHIITPHELAQIMPHQIIIYLRKSRSEKNETVEEVLARHEQILQDYATQTFGGKIPESNIYREVVSGETLDERIEIKKIFNRLESEPIRAILVVEPQRISRGGMTDCGRVVDILKYTETLVLTVTKTYDLNNKFDKQLFESQLTQGNQYLEYHKEIMDRGKNLSVREGKYVGSTPPFGYTRKPLDRGFMLIKDKNEAPIVETMYKLFVDEDLSAMEVAGYLNKNHMKPRKKELWNGGMVRHILKNEAHYGSVTWGKRPIIRKLIDGEITKMRVNSDEYMLIRGMHEPIIDKETWELAMEKIKGNPASRTTADRELQNPLAGLVFCKKCGYSLVRQRNRKHKVERKKRRKYQLDKVAINKLLREHKMAKKISSREIAEFLNISKHIVDSWVGTNTEKINFSETFSEKWYELKFLLEIDETKYDKQIITYVDPPPLNDTYMCGNQNCDMVSCSLQRIEKILLDELNKQLKQFNYYVDNYEKEIIKERVNTQKLITKINGKIEGLKIERKNLMRAKNREEYTYEEYVELKTDIENEMKELETQLLEYADSEQEDNLTKYKKSIPNLQKCLNEYNKLTVPQKNEQLKSLVEKITYSKSKRLNWRIDEEDDLEIHVEMKL